MPTVTMDSLKKQIEALDDELFCLSTSSSWGSCEQIEYDELMNKRKTLTRRLRMLDKQMMRTYDRPFSFNNIRI